MLHSLFTSVIFQKLIKKKKLTYNFFTSNSHILITLSFAWSSLRFMHWDHYFISRPSANITAHQYSSQKKLQSVKGSIPSNAISKQDALDLDVNLNIHSFMIFHNENKGNRGEKATVVWLSTSKIRHMLMDMHLLSRTHRNYYINQITIYCFLIFKSLM